MNRKVLWYGGGALLALLLLSSRRLSAGSPGPAINPGILQMGPISLTGSGAVTGATIGTDQTDFSPSWIPDTSTGDPSMADPNNPLAGVGLDATDPQNAATIAAEGAMH